MATQLSVRAVAPLKAAAFDPLRLSRRASRPAAPRRATVAKAGRDAPDAAEDTERSRGNVGMVALLASTLILSAPLAMPDDAWAARSSGRMGGSSFRSAPRSAPRASAPRGGNTNVYVAPPIYGGGMGYGYGGGMSFMPSIFMPFGFGFGGFSLISTIFQFFVVVTLLQVAFAFFSGLANGGGAGGRDKDDEDTM